METIHKDLKRLFAAFTLALALLIGFGGPALAYKSTAAIKISQCSVGSSGTSAAQGGPTAEEAVAYARSLVGKRIDVDNGPLKNPYQCVDVAQAYYIFLGQTPAYVDGGDYSKVELPYGWRRYTYRKGLQVLPGDIAYMVNGGEGHVSVITEVSKTHYKSVNQNLNLHSFCEEVELPLGSSMTGIIRPSFNQSFKTPVKAKKVSVSPKAVSIGLSQMTPVKATISPSNTSIKDVVWTSENPTIARVYKTLQGEMIIANHYGTTVLTAKSYDGNAVGQCTVTVGSKSTISATSLKLNKKKFSIEAGNTYTLRATVMPSNAAIKTVTWKSSKPSIASVDSNGKVKGIKSGSAIISATVDGTNLKVNCEVEVMDSDDTAKPAVTSLELNKKQITINKGSSFPLQANLKSSSDAKLRWVSSNSSVAQVSGSGVVTAKSAGKARISAIVVGAQTPTTAYCDVTVKAVDKVEITLNHEALTLSKGYTYQLEANVVGLKSDDDIIWTSSDENIAKVSNTGMVRCLKKGKASITATVPGGAARAICDVTVR